MTPEAASALLKPYGYEVFSSELKEASYFPVPFFAINRIGKTTPCMGFYGDPEEIQQFIQDYLKIPNAFREMREHQWTEAFLYTSAKKKEVYNELWNTILPQLEFSCDKYEELHTLCAEIPEMWRDVLGESNFLRSKIPTNWVVFPKSASMPWAPMESALGPRGLYLFITGEQEFQEAVQKYSLKIKEH